MAYFVTIQEGRRTGFMAGPYRTHGAALAAVEPVRQAVVARRPEAHWMAFGTARTKTPTARLGSANHLIGYDGPGALP